MATKIKKDPGINSHITLVKGNSKTGKYITKSGSTSIKGASATIGVAKSGDIKGKSFNHSSAKGSYLNRGTILSNATNKPENHMTPLEKMSMVRFGLSKKDLEKLKERAELDYDDLAKALSVTRATLINKKGKDKFNKTLSERIVGLADIYSYGYEVFEDEDRFNQWMFSPNQALGGQAPYELLDNQFGREEVRNIIGRIDYGVYS